MIPSPLTLNQQPVVPRLNKRIYWAGGIGLGLICLAMWSALTKKEAVRPAPEPLTVAKKELPDVLKQDPPTPAPVPVPTPQPVMQQPQQQTYRPAPQPRVATPKPPKPPKQESEKEKALREAMTASPLVIRGEGNASQTLEIGKHQASQYTLDGTLQPAPSKYVLLAGSIIPATLQTGIESSLEGSLFALVSSDVMDSLTQSHVVMPMGTRLQGLYSKEVEQGQARVMAIWQRAIYPNGSSLSLGDMSVTDTSGYTGVEGKVNRHFWAAFGRSLLYSAITASAALGQTGFRGSSVFDTISPGDVASRELSRELGSEARRLARRGEEIRPAITVLPGERVTVLVTKDIAFQANWVASKDQIGEFHEKQ